MDEDTTILMTIKSTVQPSLAQLVWTKGIFYKNLILFQQDYSVFESIGHLLRSSACDQN